MERKKIRTAHERLNQENQGNHKCNVNVAEQLKLIQKLKTRKRLASTTDVCHVGELIGSIRKLEMLDKLCLIFMTGYFGYDGSYHPVPKNTNVIEIRTASINAYMKKVDDDLWMASMNGKFFYSTLDSFTKSICKAADKQKLPEIAYKERSIIEG
jgi:hypothetical protein